MRLTTLSAAHCCCRRRKLGCLSCGSRRTGFPRPTFRPARPPGSSGWMAILFIWTRNSRGRAFGRNFSAELGFSIRRYSRKPRSFDSSAAADSLRMTALKFLKFLFRLKIESHAAADGARRLHQVQSVAIAANDRDVSLCQQIADIHQSFHLSRQEAAAGKRLAYKQIEERIGFAGGDVVGVYRGQTAAATVPLVRGDP